jgi:hypothetical protein
MKKLQEKIHDIENKIMVMKSTQDLKDKIPKKTVITIVRADPNKTPRQYFYNQRISQQDDAPLQRRKSTS